MRLEPLYQQDRERAKQEGKQDLIIRLINRRFGETDPALIERIRELFIEQLEGLEPVKKQLLHVEV